MRILLIGTTVLPSPPKGYGGIEMLIWDFANHLSRRGHEVTLVAVKGSKPPEGVQLIETGDPKTHQDREDLAFECYAHRLAEFDVIHDFSHQHIASRRLDLPSVNMIWDPVIYKYPKAPYNLVGLSEWQAARVRAVYGQGCQWQHLLVDPSKYTFCEKKYTFCEKKEDFFVFVARFTPGKGALEAISIAKRAGIKLYVIGGNIPTDPTDYEKQVRESCDGKHAIFLGNIGHKEKIELMSRAKAFIYPLKQVEATSQVIAESLMCGTPVIVFNHSSMPELIDHGVSGFLVRDEQGFIDAIERVEDISPYSCRASALKRFSPEVVIPWYEKLYEKVKNGMRW